MITVRPFLQTVILTFTFFLISCETADLGTGSTALPALTFENYQPLPLNMGQISRVVQPATVGSAENVVYFPFNVERAFHNYLARRFPSHSDMLTTDIHTYITVKNLVTEVRDIKNKDLSFIEKIEQVFAGQTSYRIAGYTEIAMKNCHGGSAEYHQGVNFEKTIFVSNSSSPYERDLRVIAMMEELVGMIDKDIVQVAQDLHQSCVM